MFKFIFCLGLPLFGMAQIQVFFPKTSPKEHQRALITLANGQILSGSSEANIRLHKSNCQVQQSINLGASFKEIRDLAQTPNGFIALQSHDSSGLELLNKSLEIDTIIYPLSIGKKKRPFFRWHLRARKFSFSARRPHRWLLQYFSLYRRRATLGSHTPKGER